MRLHRIARPACAVSLLFCLVGSSAVAGADWSLVVLPDTQHYVDSSNRVAGFLAQTQWIADNADARNIEFVSHVGDLVQHGDSTTQWNRAEQAMDIIHGVVPYGACIGDHDYEMLMRRARGFMEDGDKVKVTIRFRGRENERPELGHQLVQRLIEDLDGLANLEQAPEKMGRQMTSVLAPDQAVLRALREAQENESDDDASED